MTKPAFPLAILITLLVSTACPAENTCENDLDCAAGQVCAADGTCEEDTTVGPEPEGGPEAVLPETTLDSVPQELSNDDTPTFAFSCDRSTCGFECSLDEAAFSSCRSPVEPGALEDGLHTFAVRAVTGALVDATPAEVSFTIDTAAPVLAITQAPLELTQETTATFVMTCEGDCSMRCSIDGEQPQPCTSPFERTALADGPHSFSLQGTDGAGNTTEVAADWIVDTAAPDLLVNGPGVAAVAPSLDISFSSTAVATFECSLDDAAFSQCTSPTTLANLANGPHTFAVIATDEAGNTSPPSEVAFTVDAEAPSVVVNTAPVSPSSRVDETVFFSCPEVGCSFECSLDGEAFAPCSSPLNLTGLTIGDHALDIRATDLVGNQGTPVTLNWTIERIFSAMSHNGGGFCAIANDSTLWCWGNGAAFGLQPDFEDPVVILEAPAQIGTRRDWVAVDMNLHTCVQSDAGELACFGNASGGPLGLGDTNYRVLPEVIPTLTNVSHFVAGFLRTCAIADGDVYCWGANNFGNVLGLGDSFAGDLRVPNVVVGSANMNAKHLFATNDHMFASTQTDALWRWGGSSGGPVTNDVPTLDRGPVVTQGSSGTFVACFQVVGDGFYCGPNNTEPVLVDTDENWIAMTPSIDHICGIRLDRSVQCWDRGAFAGRVDRGLSGVIALESFDSLICALDAAGAVHCFSTPTGAVTTTEAPQTPAQ